MINLTEAQRTFEAAAKVIQVADELLQTVLSLRP
jgi:flagellar hook-associated protein FlgK